MRMCFSTRSPFSARTVLESSMPMMRSESRTEETSGLVTITASSAKRIAMEAPRSMPAGLSQITQSKRLRRSAMTLPTPSSVSASLSRVCEAGSSQRFSSRLSLISACGSFATPCNTLMRSNTTRRSAPITRSRLRKPTSKSTTTTFSPRCASAAPSAAVVVVLPTPPLPDVTTSTLAISQISFWSVQRSNSHGVALEPGLSRPAAQGRVDIVGGLVKAIDCKQFGLDLLTIDACARVAVHARHGTAAQRAVDVNGAAGNDLGAGADRTQNGDVAFGKDHGLAGAHGAFEQQRSRLGLDLCLNLLGRTRLDHAAPPARQQRRHHGGQPALLHALDPEHADVAVLKAREQMADAGLAEIDRGQVDHHGAAGEEARRARDGGVDLLQPVLDGNRRHEHEGHIGAPAQANHLALRFYCSLHSGRLVPCY